MNPDAGDIALTSDLEDIRDTALADLAKGYLNGQDPLARTLRRIAPSDGIRILLAAASFNSAI